MARYARCWQSGLTTPVHARFGTTGNHLTESAGRNKQLVLLFLGCSSHGVPLAARGRSFICWFVVLPSPSLLRIAGVSSTSDHLPRESRRILDSSLSEDQATLDGPAVARMTLPWCDFSVMISVRVLYSFLRCRLFEPQRKVLHAVAVCQSQFKVNSKSIQAFQSRTSFIVETPADESQLFFDKGSRHAGQHCWPQQRQSWWGRTVDGLGTSNLSGLALMSLQVRLGP